MKHKWSGAKAGPLVHDEKCQRCGMLRTTIRSSKKRGGWYWMYWRSEAGFFGGDKELRNTPGECKGTT